MITKNEISSLNMSPTKKDFVQIWNELIEIASKITERWDPTSTNESDPGIVLLKVLAGIADKLNYNIDKNILEAFMPTAAQMESMQKLCELVGYDIKYYQSAETTARISYTGEEEIEGFGLPIPKFTTITNADKDIAFVTTNSIPLYITNSVPWVEVPCIEGQISQCESSNENNLITLAQLDDNNRYYLPETQIAENGIFVHSAATSITAEESAVLGDGTAWKRVSNLNVQEPNTRVFKFGYDSFEGRPYIAFPDDIGSLMGDGVFIYFVRTSGINGNISPRTLEILEIPTGDAWSSFSAEQFEVVNDNAAINGANIESISTAYNNFKKTVGTFDTLVTCRDYMNKIYTLMDANNSPYVSNILVTDIRNDINNAITLCSFNEYGILYKESPLTDNEGKNLIDHFDLLLYPFKTFNQVSSGTDDLVTPYNESFTYSEHMNREIEASLSDLKTCAHNLAAPKMGDLVAINNYLRLNALIATSTRVSEAEAEDILKNVKVALVNEFNLRNLDFGEEIPFDSILSVIENADARIKVVSLQEPVLLTTYSVKEQESDGTTTIVTSKEYGIASPVDIEADINNDTYENTIYGVTYKEKISKAEETEVSVYCKTAKDIYNKLVLRNILAGRASLFEYDTTFIPNNSEKPYTITKDITATITEGNALAEAVAATVSAARTKAAEVFGNVSINKPVGYKASYTYDFMLVDEDGDPIISSNGGTLASLVKVSLEKGEGKSPETNFRVYETYEHNFLRSEGSVEDSEDDLRGDVTDDTKFNGIIKDIAKVSALCEIKSNSEMFNNITLAKNEVIKFRAPNLITTRTFPAYVYYHYAKNPSNSDSSSVNAAARPATVRLLIDFINDCGFDNFFTNLWSDTNIVSNLKEIIDKQGSSDQADQSSRLPAVFNTALAVGLKIEAAALPSLTLVFQNASAIIGDAGFRTIVNDIVKLTEYLESYLEAHTWAADQIYDQYKSNFEDTLLAAGMKSKTEYLAECAAKYAEILSEQTEFKFNYYPLDLSTMSNWSTYIKKCYSDSTGLSLPDEMATTLWRISTTYSHIPGKLVTATGQRLYAQSGDFLANNNVGNVTYICTDLGEDAKFSTIVENGDVQLNEGDKLYIHYTPSSTNEEGETVNADPVSIVFEGNSEEPIILRPSGFTLIPSVDVKASQNISWKKTVKFGNTDVGLLSLGANEQIELRSISRVQLTKPARFYKNFDNVGLENGTLTEYELKDGEYIFYTDQNGQNAAYYGSGSVITLEGGAYIPKAAQKKEVSEILTHGLHIVPWSSLILLNDTKNITVTEYQYITLTEGDTINNIVQKKTNLTDGSNYIIDNTWRDCESASYRFADAESDSTLPTLELLPSLSSGWQVCSQLELATSPAHTQTLRAVETATATQANSISRTSVVDKLEIYTDTGAEALPAFEIAPQITENPALGFSEDNGEAVYQKVYEPVSIKLETAIKSASGNFTAQNNTNKVSSAVAAAVQMKVFKESEPAIIELTSSDEVITPISAKATVPLDYSTVNVNSYWTKLYPSISLFREDPSSVENVKIPRALNLNFFIPKGLDVFGIFSIYVDTGAELYPGTKIPSKGYRVFIDVPSEFGSYEDVIAIFNNRDANATGDDAKKDVWWQDITTITKEDGTTSTKKIAISDEYPNRLYLREGLNCIKVLKSCNLLLKAEDQAANSTSGTILYDNLRLVKGRDTNGINLALLDPDAEGISKKVTNTTAEENTLAAAKVNLAETVLKKIAALDKNHEFYYNVPVENSLAMEFDNNISSFSNPHTLYDINNINNNFVISKLDVKYLDTGLKIAKSSKY